MRIRFDWKLSGLSKFQVTKAMAKNRLTFENENCKGCLLCVDACPKNILELDDKRVNAKGYNPLKCVDIDSCTACAICARICPDSVIKVERDVE